jgi:outer membrane beta-barrel protein
MTAPRRISGVAKGLTSVLAAGLALLAFTETASAQEIQLTGPLAGAPAVRKLRLYRQARFEIAPAVSFTLLDEYQRTILLGARLTYNLTDWFGIGAWGGYGGLIRIPTSLTDHIQEVNRDRRRLAGDGYENTVTGRLTAVNLGADLKDQIAQVDWMVAPQVTFVPFRGKISIFQAIYADTDVYFFGGPAFVGLQERQDCSTVECATAAGFQRGSRMAIAPTAGLGLTFYANKWSALGVEYRTLAYARNNGGFDTAGSGKDKAFPDNRISADDRSFSFTHLVTVSYNFYLPTQYRVSE